MMDLKMDQSENTSLQNQRLMTHLVILQNQYRKLQRKHSQLQSELDSVYESVKWPAKSDKTFVHRILQTIASLKNQEKYSDIKIKIDQNFEIPAHKFVLDAHEDLWLERIPEFHDGILDLSGFANETTNEFLEYLYTNELRFGIENADIVKNLMSMARQLKLFTLFERCEYNLMSYIDLRNVIAMYEFACGFPADRVKLFCGKLIFKNWSAFEPNDFVRLKVDDAYDLLKLNSSHPLHKAIEINRSDVVYLFILEFENELANKINDCDDEHRLPLEIALLTNQFEVAATLADNGANIDAITDKDLCLLHYFIQKGMYEAAEFLVDRGCDVDKHSQAHGTTLHLLTLKSCDCRDLIEKVIENSLDVNSADSQGNTPLHLSISQLNRLMFDLLVGSKKVDLEVHNNSGDSPLWLTIRLFEASGDAKKEFLSEILECLAKSKCSLVNPVSPDDQSPLLHRCIRSGYELGAAFLLKHLKDLDQVNDKGETALHLSAELGNIQLCRLLLDKGACPNAVTLCSSDFNNGIYGETALHRAFRHDKLEIIKEFINWSYDSCDLSLDPGSSLDFNSEDSCGETPFSLALWKGCFNTASDMVALKADCNRISKTNGLSLIHDAIERENAPATLFLIEHIRDLSQRNPDGDSVLVHAVKKGLKFVVDVLCQKGVSFEYGPNNALWIALENGRQDIAASLVQHGFDKNCWNVGPEQSFQTMLHKAIDFSNEEIACFLIESGCDLNATRRPGPNGEVPEEVTDQFTPLHMACLWGLVRVVKSLLNCGADVNATDSDGNTAFHLAVQNHENVIVALLIEVPELRLDIENSRSEIPFALALNCRNQEAIPMILRRDPRMAETVDSNGLNFLHRSILQSDLESVLFLISSGVNLNSRTRDSQSLAPIHIAAQTGSELIMRNLILAGSRINQPSANGDSALHISARNRHPTICRILCEHSIDYRLHNNQGDSALHLSVRNSDSEVLVVLLEFGADPLDLDSDSRNCLHLLALHGSQNSSLIFDCLTKPKAIDLNVEDRNGNSPILLAYKSGNSSVCRCLVRAGARLASVNHAKVSIFNHETASNNLLYTMLDSLEREPPWADYDFCMVCEMSFTMTTRRHHCRYCGRILCKKCSDFETQIVKYNLLKPVRVCQLCFDYLTLGVGILNTCAP